MSALMTCRSCMTNEKGIIRALKQLGVPEDKIQVALEEALTLQGYGRQTQEVEILVPNKQWHNGYSDFGFGRSKGKKEYNMYIDDMDDTGSLATAAGIEGKFSENVTKWYTAFMAQDALKKQGMYTKIKADGDKLVVVAQG